jgi:hypothetical protein
VVAPDSRGVSRAPRYSGASWVLSGFRLPGSHRLCPAIPCRSTNLVVPYRWSYNPGGVLRRHRFGLFRLRSPLLTESRLISFPPGTEMFHFPGLASARLWIQREIMRLYLIGFPHSDIPGSNACLRLPEAFRSLPRPSSPSSAKASTACS